MRAKQLMMGLLVAMLGSGRASAQEWIADQFELLEPGLTVEVFQELGLGGVCNVNEGRWNSFHCEDGDEAREQKPMGNGIDALGGFYQAFSRLAPPIGSTVCEVDGQGRTRSYDVERLTSTSAVTIATVPQCSIVGPSGQAQFTHLRNLTFDAVNGDLYVSVLSRRNVPSQPDEIGSGIVRISGLPTILNVVPEGPPGPPGPGGPPGPPADESRVLTLEQIVASQQAEIGELRSTLEQIEGLPVIQKLLQKIMDLEVAAP